MNSGLDLSGVHALELEMLKAVDALCKKHGIRYTIYCGTLLGAVRHKGFIPWDDDIDIAMPLKDYRRFIKLANEFAPRYYLETPYNSTDYSYIWLKLCANGTTWMYLNEAALNAHWGLSLDIYPFIGEADNRVARWIQSKLLWLARCLIKVMRVRSGREKQIGIKQMGFRLLYVIPTRIRKAISNALLRIAMLDPDKHERIGTLDAAQFEGKFARSDWQQMTELQFEDQCFSAPAAYDRILRRMYGDYMQLPPESARGGHRGQEDCFILDLNRDYREYQKVLNAPD